MVPAGFGVSSQVRVKPFRVSCGECGRVLWSSYREGAGRAVHLEEILAALERHDCKGASIDGC